MWCNSRQVWSGCTTTAILHSKSPSYNQAQKNITNLVMCWCEKALPMLIGNHSPSQPSLHGSSATSFDWPFPYSPQVGAFLLLQILSHVQTLRSIYFPFVLGAEPTRAYWVTMWSQNPKSLDQLDAICSSQLRDSAYFFSEMDDLCL